jgi:RNA polymerase-binding transcription factor DksA
VATLAELDAALDRRRAGMYGVCVSCGGRVGAERLAARPAALRCIACEVRRRR